MIPQHVVDMLLLLCALMVAVSIPMALRLVPPNLFYGFRTPFTLSNRDAWYDANAFAGWAIMVASLAGGALIYFLPAAYRAPWIVPSLFAIPAVLALVASFIYVRHLKEATERR